MAFTQLDWRPSWNADYGFATAQTDQPANVWIRKSGSHLYRNGQRWRCVGSHSVQNTQAMDDASERTGLPKRVAAHGNNCIRFLGIDTKTTPDGLWASQGGDLTSIGSTSAYRATTTVYTTGTVRANKVNGYTRVYTVRAPGGTSGAGAGPSGTSSGQVDGTVTWDYTQNGFGTQDPAQTYLNRMDEMIANYNARGVYIWMSGWGHYAQARMGAGLPSNIRPDDDAYWDNGMMWSDEWLTVGKTYYATLLERTNSITGVKYKNNPGIMCWEMFNENGLTDTFKRGWFDAIVNNDDGAGYWLTELNTKLATWWAANTSITGGGAVPSWSVGSAVGFPVFATWEAWGNATQKRALAQFLDDTEYAAAVALKAWLLTFNPNLLFCYGTSSYSTYRVQSVSDISTYHVYGRVTSGNVFSPAASPYPTRDTVMTSTNGSDFAKVFPMRTTTSVLITNELGNYGLTPYDFDTQVLWPVVMCLQDADGYNTFVEGQDEFASGVVGITALSHMYAGWPSRKLASLFASSIMKYGLIQPLPSTNTYTLDSTLLTTKEVANYATTGWTTTGNNAVAANTSNGNEWAWLAAKLYTNVGVADSYAGITSINDAAVTAGTTVTAGNGTVYWRGSAAAVPTVRLDFPTVKGWLVNVEDGTLSTTEGAMTISGSGGYKGVCAIRSCGDHPLFSGNSLLFVHGNSYPTNVSTSIPGGAWDGITVGSTINSVGTENLTRINVPASFSITFTTRRDMGVFGVTAAGALVDMSPTWNSGAGTIQFNTSASYPLYLISPKTATRARSIARKATVGR